MVRCAIGRAAQDEYLLAMSDTFDSRGIRAIHPSEILRVEPGMWVAWWSGFGQWCKISVGCVQSSFSAFMMLARAWHFIPIPDLAILIC